MQIENEVILPVVNDIRGNLVSIEFEKQIPFKVRRFFYVFGVPHEKIRGEHAHKKCHQFLVGLSGTIDIETFDGKDRSLVRLNSPSQGLIIEAGIWASQFNFSNNAILGVFASEEYDPSDYIRNVKEYLEYKRIQK